MLSRQVGPLPGPSGEEKIFKFDTSLEAYLYVFWAYLSVPQPFWQEGFTGRDIFRVDLGPGRKDLDPIK